MTSLASGAIWKRSPRALSSAVPVLAGTGMGFSMEWTGKVFVLIKSACSEENALTFRPTVYPLVMNVREPLVPPGSARMSWFKYRARYMGSPFQIGVPSGLRTTV